MKIDLGELLTLAWQISWKNKKLWWFGVVLGALVIGIFPLAFLPVLFPVLIENGRHELVPIFFGVVIVLLFLFFIVMYFVSAAVQTALTLGVLRADDNHPISLRVLLKESVPFFWRVLGVMFLYAAAIMVINLAIQAIVFAVAIGTFGLGMMCVTPLYLLMYPLMFVAIAWMEMSMNGIIIDHKAIMESVKLGWQLIRSNVMTVVLIMVVVYFGIGMVSSVLVMPMMAPFFVLPFGLVEGEPNWTVISLSLLCSAAFVPFYVLLMGWSLTLIKSAWVLTYLRLTRSTSTSQPVLQEAIA